MTFQTFLNKCKLSNDLEIKFAAKHLIRRFRTNKRPVEMIRLTINADWPLRYKEALLNDIDTVRNAYMSTDRVANNAHVDTDLYNDLGNGCWERKTFRGGVAVA